MEHSREIRARLAEIDGPKQAGTAGDENTTRDYDVIRKFADLYPKSWIDDGCAVGSPDKIAQHILDRFDAGADSVLFHGSTAQYHHKFMAKWPEYRPEKFKTFSLPVNPGYMS